MAEKNITIENARLCYRNFSGKEGGKYNKEGQRNFCVFIPPDIAPELEDDGWNVRWLKPREDGDPEQPYLSVGVTFDYYPPNITLITSGGETRLNEDEVNMLDWVDIELADLTLRPYNWEVGDKTGKKAYLKTLYVKIIEDEIEKKYQNRPDSALSSLIEDNI